MGSPSGTASGPRVPTRRIDAPAGVLSTTSRWDGGLVGLFQCLALLPGMSRSGSTISGALARLRPRRRRPLLVPAGHPQHRAGGLLRAVQGAGDAFGGELLCADHRRDRRQLRRRLRQHRLAHEVSRTGASRAFVVYRVVLGASFIGLVTAGIVSPVSVSPDTN